LLYDCFSLLRVFKFPLIYLTAEQICVRSVLGLRDEVWAELYQPVSAVDTAALLATLVRPKSRGNIRLRSADPAEPPLIDPRYYSHPDDALIMLQGNLASNHSEIMCLDNKSALMSKWHIFSKWKRNVLKLDVIISLVIREENVTIPSWKGKVVNFSSFEKKELCCRPQVGLASGQHGRHAGVECDATGCTSSVLPLLCTGQRRLLGLPHSTRFSDAPPSGRNVQNGPILRSRRRRRLSVKVPDLHFVCAFSKQLVVWEKILVHTFIETSSILRLLVPSSQVKLQLGKIKLNRNRLHKVRSGQGLKISYLLPVRYRSWFLLDSIFPNILSSISYNWIEILL